MTLTRPALLALLVVAGMGCRSSSTNAGDMVAAVVLAATSSAISRAQGDCFALCTAGTFCNRDSGLCEPLPCRGACEADQICVRKGRQEVCEHLKPVDMTVERPSDAPSPQSLNQ